MTDSSDSQGLSTALTAAPELTHEDVLADYALADFKWVPVLRRPRSDGWTPQRQVDFIAALADTGCVEQAARDVGMSVVSCYRLRRLPGAEAFAQAWEAAIAQAAQRLVDVAFERAIHGTTEPVFNREGIQIGLRRRQSDRLLMFLMRAYMPDRFRHAHQNLRHPSESQPPAPPPVAEAMQALEPPAPANPHLLMSPDALETELMCAEIGNGKLPHWYSYTVRTEPEPIPHREEIDAILDQARRENNPGWAAERDRLRAQRGEDIDDGDDDCGPDFSLTLARAIEELGQDRDEQDRVA